MNQNPLTSSKNDELTVGPCVKQKRMQKYMLIDSVVQSSNKTLLETFCHWL